MTDKELAKKILDYWYIMEILHQEALPVKQYGKKGEVSVITEVVSYNENLFEKVQERARMLEMASWSNITCYIGNIEREECIGKIAELMKKSIDFPDKVYDKIAWASLQITDKGEYVEDSFSLSPVIWAIKELGKTKNNQAISSRIIPARYDDAIRHYEENLVGEKFVEKNKNDLASEDENVTLINSRATINLQKLQDKIWEEYISPFFSTPKRKSDNIFITYTLYKSPISPEPENDDYYGLHMDFFSSDIQMVRRALDDVPDIFDHGMGKALLEYIVSVAHKDDVHVHEQRINLVPCKENNFNAEKFHEIFSQILDVKKAPLGKWPSQFMPALMQQTAVNLFINQTGENIFGKNGTVFSVNGPPGTGKTTLLKEIIVNNIVERANLLINYDEPKDAFEHENYEYGPEEYHSYSKYVRGYYRLKNDEINKYGLMVTSCNNAAVENISKELPLSLGIIQAFDEKNLEQQKIRNLFDISKTEIREMLHTNELNSKALPKEVPDIYFSKYAKDLLKEKDGKSPEVWGLVAIALGKKSNINKFSKHVLAPLVTRDFLKTNNAIQERLVKWENIRNEFKKQRKKVQDMQDHIADQCKAERTLRALSVQFREKTIAFEKAQAALDNWSITQEGLPAFDKRINTIRQNIAEIEGQYQKTGFIFRKKANNDYNKELDRRIANLKNEKEKIEKEEAMRQWLQNKRNIMKQEHADLDEKVKEVRASYGEVLNTDGIPLDDVFMEKFMSDNIDSNTKAQISNPWFSESYNREREKLFWLAMQVHKEFVLSSKECRTNLNNLMMIWKVHPNIKGSYHPVDRQKCMASLLQTLWLLVPVISTTFASVGRFLQDIKDSSVLGTLIVDEAGQAQPQMAIGSLFRMKQAIIVGDPKQVEPVITGELDLLKQSYEEPYYIPYRDKKNSVQKFADQINCLGTWMPMDENPEGKEWVGCPLLVHRRCTDPMYSISNLISYNGMMKQQTFLPDDKKKATFFCEKSIWIDIRGAENGKKDHFVKAQGDAVREIVDKAFSLQSGVPSIYIISPFTSVVRGIRQCLLKTDNPILTENKNFKAWCQTHIGTVHTFQGKEANEVIFLLGCDNSASADPAIRWVNSNIVNVAATRAKYRLCVIGNRDAWKKSSCVGKMMELLDMNISSD